MGLGSAIKLKVRVTLPFAPDCFQVVFPILIWSNTTPAILGWSFQLYVIVTFPLLLPTKLLPSEEKVTSPLSIVKVAFTSNPLGELSSNTSFLELIYFLSPGVFNPIYLIGGVLLARLNNPLKVTSYSLPFSNTASFTTDEPW